MANVTIADLTLPTGITANVAQYPTDSSALALLADLLEAFAAAQTAQNIAAPTGSDVRSLTIGNGAPQQIEYPPASGTFVQVSPRIYQLTVLRQLAVSNTFPVLA